MKHKLADDKETQKDRPLHFRAIDIRILIPLAFVSGRTTVTERGDGPERLPIIIFFSPVR